MAVVPLTLTISLCLVFTFVVFFLREHARGSLSSVERDSLLHLSEETPRVLPTRLSRSSMSAHDDEHAHSSQGHADCGCHNGARPPCAGCRKTSSRA